MVGEDLLEGCLDELDIGAVGNTDGDHGADAWVWEIPVGNRVFEEVGVGNDDGDAVVSLDVGGAWPDLENFSRLVVDRHEVIDLDGALEHHDEPRDEVVHDVLGTEADA